MDKLSKWDLRCLNLVNNTISKWSKDPDKKVGCVIATPDFRKISYGYNGFIKKSNDNYKISKKEKNKLTIHAELNAILNSPFDIAKCFLYTNYPICMSCALHIIQSDIAKVCFPTLKKDSRWYKSQKEAIVLFNNANIKILNF